MRDYVHVTFVGGPLDLSRRVFTYADARVGEYLIQEVSPLSAEQMHLRRGAGGSYHTTARVVRYLIRQVDENVWLGLHVP